jgi:cysteine desulfurase
MGVLSEGNVRVSLAPGTPAADVDRFLEVLPGAVAAVREKLGAPAGAPAGGSAVGAGSGGAGGRSGDAGGRPFVLDALGKLCPLPVIELAKVIGGVPVGGTVRVLADDEAARLDIPAWCEMRGQEYVGEETAERGSVYVVRRVS